MSLPYYDRLLKLATFLGTLKPEQFYFGDWIQSYDEDGCGTVCCAMGWTPKLFPKSIRYNAASDLSPKLNGASRSWIGIANDFFGLYSDDRGNNEACDLFLPDWSNGLTKDSTATEVAAHIRQFVEKKCLYEFRESCYKMSVDELAAWHQVLKKTRQCRETFGFNRETQNCNRVQIRDVVGAYATAHRKFKQWIRPDGTDILSQDHMPVFRWYEVYDEENTGDPYYECAAVVLNDDFKYTFAQFRKLIREVYNQRVLAGESKAFITP